MRLLRAERPCAPRLAAEPRPTPWADSGPPRAPIGGDRGARWPAGGSAPAPRRAGSPAPEGGVWVPRRGTRQPARGPAARQPRGRGQAAPPASVSPSASGAPEARARAEHPGSRCRSVKRTRSLLWGREAVANRQSSRCTGGRWWEVWTGLKAGHRCVRATGVCGAVSPGAGRPGSARRPSQVGSQEAAAPALWSRVFLALCRHAGEEAARLGAGRSWAAKQRPLGCGHTRGKL